MALTRSASGPGGLSINTNSANSLFGSSTAPAAGGMFGSTQAKPVGGLFGSQPAQPGGLFGSSTTTQPATGGLFGAAPASAQTQAGGLFAPAAATTQPQSGGLFGSAQPSQAGGLFGGTAATTQPQSGGLFGAAKPAQSGGLFGNSTQTTQAGGLFGATAATSQPQQTSSLFGGLAGQPNQPANTLFGGSTTQSNAGGMFTNPNKAPASNFAGGQLNQNNGQGLLGARLGGGLGQSTNNQQSTVPGVRIDSSQIKGTTRYNDLHDEIQKEIQKFDDIIQGQIKLKRDCDAIMPAHNLQLKQVPNDVEFCRRKLIGVENAADTDVQAIAIAQKLIKTDAEHAKLSFKAIDNLKLPPQYHDAQMWSPTPKPQTDGDSEAQDIVSFFSSTADELASTLASYQKHMVEIEQHLRNVESASVSQQSELLARRNGAGLGQSDPMEQLTGALVEFESSLLGVAGHVGSAREGLQNLQLGSFTGNRPGSSRDGGYRNGVY